MQRAPNGYQLPALRARREAAGLTQTGLALRCQLSQATIARLEAGGRCHPTTATVIAQRLGTTVLDLRGEG